MLILLLTAAVALSLIGYKHIQKELTKKLISEFEFSEANERKTDLDLTNVDLEFQNKKMEMDITTKDVEGLEVEVKKMVMDQQKMEEEVKACQGSLVTINENIAGVEKEKGDIEGNFAASKTKWTEAMTDLQKKLKEISPICAHVKNGTDANGQCPQAKENPSKAENKQA